MRQFEYCLYENIWIRNHECIQLVFSNGKVINVEKRDWSGVLSSLGNDGWEMVGVAGTDGYLNIYFKRELTNS